MAKNINYRCLNCGGDLAWNAELQSWKCEYCDSTFTLEQLEKAGKAEVHEESIEKGQEVTGAEKTTDGTSKASGSTLVEYTCSYCGAKIITDATTAATFCAYCQNPIVISEKLVGDFAPDKVIPFAKEKKTVMMEYKKFVKKPLTPKLFFEQNTVEKLTGVYIPFFLYDMKEAGSVNVRGTRVSTWRDSKNIYTKTDEFQCEITGSMEYSHVPVDSSSKTDDAAMDSIEPFRFTDMKDFSPAYLAGYLAERYDEEEEDMQKRAEERIHNTTRQRMLAEAPAYDSASILGDQLQTSVKQRTYVLLPTWILNTKYKDKEYLFAMNGQTGKFVGNLPIDIGKLLMYGGGTFIASFAVIWGIARLIFG
ncbi:MAG: hypothetical protein PHG16_08820 [Lachnospiraceae bacterium]|nr:hypothetical protein [Lachnospiraceae bacterium]